jgi:stage II sporulation protein D
MTDRRDIIPLEEIPGLPGEDGWRRRFRSGSALLVAILMAVAALPIIVLSCAGASYREVAPREALALAEQPKVRVALDVNTRDGPSLPIKVIGGYDIIDPIAGTTLVRGPRLLQSPIQSLSGGVVIVVPDRQGLRKTVRLPRIRIAPAKSGTLFVGGRHYRGVLDVIYTQEGRMSLVNDLDLEEYVGGVVTAEMAYWWPNEALRAQAVATRTYTLALISEKAQMTPRPEWDIEAGYITAQEYCGLQGEHARGLEATLSTRGVILTYQGKVFRAYFSSCCSGHTEACGLTWDDYPTIPPLAGRPCDYCTASKFFNWEKPVVLKRSEIENALKRADKDVGELRDLAFEDTNHDGHYDRVTVTGSRQTLTMLGNDFRLIIGPKLLLSMNFKVRRVGTDYEFDGHGWGHGVGMCQYGAKGMADVLLTYDRIVAYYYPDTELWKVY